MVKGLIALFTSGAIFHPMILLGIVSGIIGYAKLDAEEVRSLAGEPLFYAVVFFGVGVYTVVFAKIYKNGGSCIDWNATLWNVVPNALRYVAAVALTMSFIWMIDIF